MKITRIIQRWVPHEITVSLSDFDLFLTLPYYQKFVNQVNLNHATLLNLALPIFEVFFQFLLNVNLSLNQTLLTLLYVRQT